MDLVKVRATAKLIDNVRSIGDNLRTHTIVCDLPISAGGTDMGPTALEIAVIALADCAVTIYADVAKKSGIELTKLEAVAEAEKPADSPKLTGVNLKLNVSGKARKKLLEALLRRTEANCPVLYIFKESIPIKTELEVSEE